MRRWIAALAAVCVLAGTPRARSESPADVDAARELFREGTRLAQEGRWEEARDSYSRSLALKHAPITLYSLGVANHRLGKLVEALESLRGFLVEARGPTTAPYEQPARDLIAELDRRVARLSLSIEPAGVAGLAVTIDSEPVPPAALAVPRLVNPGRHEIVASASGYRPARATVRSAEGSVQPVKLVLVPDGSAIAPAVLPPPPSAPEAPSRALPITLMAAGGAAIVAGVAVGLVGVKEASRAPAKSGPEADAALTKAIAGDIVAGAGAAAAVAGLIVLIVRWPRANAPRAAVVTPWASGPTAGIRLRF